MYMESGIACTVTLEGEEKIEMEEILTRGWTVETSNDKACRIFSLKTKKAKCQGTDEKAGRALAQTFLAEFPTNRLDKPTYLLVSMMTAIDVGHPGLEAYFRGTKSAADPTCASPICASPTYGSPLSTIDKVADLVGHCHCSKGFPCKSSENSSHNGRPP